MRGLMKFALAAVAMLVAHPALASINFGNPYVFASQAEAEKGIRSPSTAAASAR